MADEMNEIEAESVDEDASKQDVETSEVREDASVPTERLKAVFRMGARQYCAGIGDRVSVPDYRMEAEIQDVTADVLMVTGDRTIVGTPLVLGAKVTLELSSIRRGERLISFKRRRRKHSSKRTKGHKGFVFDFVVKNFELPNDEQAASVAAGA